MPARTDWPLRRRYATNVSYEHNAELTADPFLLQPESLMVFFLLEQDREALGAEWIEHLPFGYLQDLAALWDTPLM